MKLLGQPFAVLFSLAFLGALGIDGYFAMEYIVSLCVGMESQLRRVTAIASGVALLAAMIIASSIREASKQSQANQLHAQKATTYELLIEQWEKLRQRCASEDRRPSQLPEELHALDRVLALYDRLNVIRAHTALRVSARTRNPDVRWQFGKALMEIRKDLGSDTRDLAPEDFQRLLFPNAQRFDFSEESKDPQPGRAPGATAS